MDLLGNTKQNTKEMLRHFQDNANGNRKEMLRIYGGVLCLSKGIRRKHKGDTAMLQRGYKGNTGGVQEGIQRGH